MRIRKLVAKYVLLPKALEQIVPYYVLLTWLYDRFETVPYLRCIGDLGTGKSRALKVIGALCYHPFNAAGSSTLAPLFRGLDMFGGGTLVMDECDLQMNNGAHQELMTVLRQGFQKGAGVLRAEAVGDTFEPKDHDVFGPKILAGRQNFPDPALESRCIRVYMPSVAVARRVPVELPDAFKVEAMDLQNQLLSWRFENFFRELPEPEALTVEARQLQLYLPLARLIEDPVALAAPSLPTYVRHRPHGSLVVTVA